MEKLYKTEKEGQIDFFNKNLEKNSPVSKAVR